MKPTFAVVVLCVLSTGLTAWAQVDTATVTGTIQDSNGAVLPNVTVTATEMDTGISVAAKSASNGGRSPSNGNAGGSFAVNGTRGDQNDFILDGVDNVSNDNADVAILSSVDAIAEFKIQTSNYSPEFGRGGGAVINASTKSGTNNFHGEVWEFLRNQAFDARGYFEQQDSRKAPYKQ